MEDRQVPYYFLADPGFPISEFLIPTYDRRNGLSRPRTRFNRRHSCARDVVERMFGQVKGRWRALLKPIELKRLGLVVKVISCAFLLHNYCIRQGDACPDQWYQEAQNEAAKRRNQFLQPPTEDGDIGDNEVPASSKAKGTEIRETLLQLDSIVPYTS